MKKDSSIAVSRRSFLKSAAALGATATIYGCSKSDENEIYVNDTGIIYPEPPNPSTTEFYYVSGGHNCGAKCVSKAWVKNGRVVRVTSVGEEAVPGVEYDPDSYANPQQRSCTRCRGNKYRLYHPGRLKYPLKQTKERGNLSGFIRISWEEAMDELARKHKAIINKYGPESIYSLYACGSYTGAMQGGGYSGIWTARSGGCLPLNYVGGAARYQGDYSYHQRYNWNENYTGYSAGSSPTINQLAGGSVKNFISFGDNSMTTRSNTQHAQITAYKKARENGTNIIYIAPELVDMGVNIADEFIPTKPYTTAALLAGMLHTMLINTFDENGNILPDTHNGGNGGPAGPWLDVDFLDAAVYGFFDSPEYWIKADATGFFAGTESSGGGSSVTNPVNADATGTIYYYADDIAAETATRWKRVEYKYWLKTSISSSSHDGNPLGTLSIIRPTNETGYTYKEYRWQNIDTPTTYAYTSPLRKINAVPAGMSYSAWLMGNDPRLTRAQYANGRTYIADRFSTVQTYRNADLCNQPVAQGSNTAYLRKQQYRTPKDAAWASKITGIPEQRIKELAGMWVNPAQHPIWCTHGFGLEKQLDGIFSRFAINAFLIITKTFGQNFHGWNLGGTNGFSTQTSTNPNAQAMPSYALNRDTTPATNAQPTAPNLSVAQWHNAIRMAFMDVMLDPNKGSKVYTAKHIPDYEPTVDFKPAAQSKDLSRWKSYIGRVYHDDGGAKALVKLDRPSLSGTPEIESATGMNLYVTEGTKPVYSGYRWIMNSGGNILMNQHMNPNDTREMLESIPSCGETNNPDDPNDLCIVSFDPFLSASPRWSDYVLPAATQWEFVNSQSAGGQSVVIPVVSQPPGESKDPWDMTIAWLTAYEKIRTELKGMTLQFIGRDNTGGATNPIPGDTYIDKYKRAYAATTFARSSRYYGKTFEEALKVQYVLPKPGTMAPVKASSSISGTRLTIENYIQDLKSGSKSKTDPFFVAITTATSVPAGYGSEYINGTVHSCPADTPSRYQVYTEMIEWGYQHRYEKWHKHLTDQGLPAGQRPDDIEGDPIIPRIPYYLNYEDSFMEAYGGPDAMPPKGNRFLVTTTHDRHRAHSSVSESPLVRELTTRVRGGKPYSGNDWGTYSLSEIDKDGKIPRLNSAIGEFGRTTDFKRASWIEVLMNEKDATDLGITDGDLIEMRNPVGAVRVIARTTKRAARGYIALHQGGWYDPDPIDGVDDGGCCNTLMCAKPSRLDHGNGQQSAMVQIKKVF